MHSVSNFTFQLSWCRFGFSTEKEIFTPIWSCLLKSKVRNRQQARQSNWVWYQGTSESSVHFAFPKASSLCFSVLASSVSQVKACRCREMSSAACCTPRARCVPRMCCGLRCRRRGPTAVYKPSCKYFNYPVLELKSTQQSAGMENMPLVRGGQSRGWKALSSFQVMLLWQGSEL